MHFNNFRVVEFRPLVLQFIVVKISSPHDEKFVMRANQGFDATIMLQELAQRLAIEYAKQTKERLATVTIEHPLHVVFSRELPFKVTYIGAGKIKIALNAKTVTVLEFIDANSNVLLKAPIVEILQKELPDFQVTALLS